ncbi:hypothetical protein BGX24_007884 [Mortierella sp. AD032]|nr:hypothetical protein BGX24_007884 [Mortierella sp. AD032]
MLAHSPSSATATTESYKATLPAKSTARRESIRRQTTTTTQSTPTQTQVSLSEAQTKTQTQTQQRTPHQQGGVQFPTPIAEEQDFADESDNPFMSKEEFKRPAPQAILPEGFKHAQFTLPLPPVPSQGNKLENYSSDDDSIDLDTGRLVLEPYLTPAELAAHVPFPAPAVPYKYVKDSAPSSSAAVAADQLVNQNAAPIRPPRRTADASDQPNLSQSKIQEQRLQQPQQQPPQSAHPLASSADAPWPLVHRSPNTPATPRFAPGHSPPIVEGNDYGWAIEKCDDDENYKVAVPQAKKPRVPEAVGGGTRLSHFNYDV